MSTSGADDGLVDRAMGAGPTAAKAVDGTVGALGVVGVLAVAANLKRTQAAVDSVSPATMRGTLKVLGLLVVIIGLALLGLVLVPSVGGLWFVIAGAVVIGLNEQYRRARASRPSSRGGRRF